MKRVLVGGAGGFIGGHLARRLREEGFWVRGVDLKRPEYSETACHEFVVADLRDQGAAAAAVDDVQDVYQLAADMGGAGYIFTGEHDAAVMHNSATINLNLLEAGRLASVKRFFYSSSACIYPEFNQMDQIIRSALKTRRTRPHPIANTGGRSCSANACTSRISGITGLKFT